MNTPYVKEYDEKGELLNPIKGKYVNAFPNRRMRKPDKKRFLRNKKNYPLVVHGSMAYEKVVQHEFDKEDNSIIIEHYLPKRNYKLN